MKICENCGKEHDGSYGSGRFCSHSCQASFTNKNRGKRNQETIEKIQTTVAEAQKKQTLTYKIKNFFKNILKLKK